MSAKDRKKKKGRESLASKSLKTSGETYNYINAVKNPIEKNLRCPRNAQERQPRGGLRSGKSSTPESDTAALTVNEKAFGQRLFLVLHQHIHNGKMHCIKEVHKALGYSIVYTDH